MAVAVTVTAPGTGAVRPLSERLYLSVARRSILGGAIMATERTRDQIEPSSTPRTTPGARSAQLSRAAAPSKSAHYPVRSGIFESASSF